nr:aminoglycoside phosphotransferase family protein [Ruegeria sp. R14_0]
MPATTYPPSDLVDDLRDRDLVGPGVAFQILYGGRTNQVWKVLGGGGDKVLKLYRATPRNPLFRNDPELEAECLRALEPTGFVPRLRAAGAHKSGHWVFYDHAPGSPWRKNPEGVATLLRSLHELELRIQAPKGCNGSADLADHAEQILNACTSDTRALVAKLRPAGHVPATKHTCLIHADTVAGNILVAPTGMTLIDWQCPAWGDPCEDIAMFLSPAMQCLYRGSPLTQTEEALFLNAYGVPETVARFRELRPWYAWRMAAYCLWRMENGAADYARSLELEVAAL